MITSIKLLQRAQNTFCTLCLYGEYSGFGVENPETVKVLNLVSNLTHYVFLEETIMIDITSGVVVPFFDDKNDERVYSIYNDGGHYIAVPRLKRSKKGVSTARELTATDIAFNSLFSHAVENGLEKRALAEYVEDEMTTLFPEITDMRGFVAEKIIRKHKNLYNRKKRFRRKAYLNKWNYFVTITFDDKKHDEISFRKKLRRCLSNLHTRRGWKYMGVFEYAPETHRLHFHAIMYIPDGEMIGNIAELRDYSTAQGQMQITHSNTFFADSFGRNDFEKLNEQELRHGGTINYLLKYISKTGERIVYSRGIPTAICMKVKDKDIATSMEDYVTKYLLFDDVIKYERDIARYKTKQMTFIDIFCNPPKVA